MYDKWPIKAPNDQRDLAAEEKHRQFWLPNFRRQK